MFFIIIHVIVEDLKSGPEMHNQLQLIFQLGYQVLRG